MWQMKQWLSPSHVNRSIGNHHLTSTILIVFYSTLHSCNSVSVQNCTNSYEYPLHRNSTFKVHLQIASNIWNHLEVCQLPKSPWYVLTWQEALQLRSIFPSQTNKPELWQTSFLSPSNYSWETAQQSALASYVFCQINRRGSCSVASLTFK